MVAISTEPAAAAPAASSPPPAQTATTHAVAHIEADFNDEADTTSDGDSALGLTTDESSITTSIKSSIYQYRQENGRTYHQYKDGQYAYPNDEAERDRLDLQHHLYKLTMDQKLHLSPLKKDIQNALDIGTGTGLWAIEFAEEHPSAVVIGTDLSPIQPQFVPPNLSFMIDDANEDWVFPQKFDFIHMRQMHCAVNEKKLLKQSYDNLLPGGWVEMQELSPPPRNDDGTQSPSDPLALWSQHMIKASRIIGQDLDNPDKYAQWMLDAGFVNVRQVMYKWPLNTWPKGTKEKTLGLWTMANALDGVSGFSMAVFTRILGWKPEEVELFLVGVKNDIRDKSKHNYYPVFVTYGQKPEEPDSTASSPEAAPSPEAATGQPAAAT